MKHIIYEINNRQDVRKKIVESDNFSIVNYEFEKGWQLLLEYPETELRLGDNIYHDITQYEINQGINGYVVPSGFFIYVPKFKFSQFKDNYLSSIDYLLKLAQHGPSIDNEYYKKGESILREFIHFSSNENFSKNTSAENVYWSNFKVTTESQLKWIKENSKYLSTGQKKSINAYLMLINEKNDSNPSKEKLYFDVSLNDVNQEFSSWTQNELSKALKNRMDVYFREDVGNYNLGDNITPAQAQIIRIGLGLANKILSDKK